MKLSKKAKRGGNLQLNMTPMIDCVFLLLIFFMSCTQVSILNTIPMPLPRAPGTDDQTDATITINVDQGGDLIVDGIVVELPQLAAILTDAIKDKGDDPERINIVLRMNRDAKAKPFNQILEVLKAVKITRLRTRTETE